MLLVVVHLLRSRIKRVVIKILNNNSNQIKEVETQPQPKDDGEKLPEKEESKQPAAVSNDQNLEELKFDKKHSA